MIIKPKIIPHNSTHSIPHNENSSIKGLNNMLAGSGMGEGLFIILQLIILHLLFIF